MSFVMNNRRPLSRYRPPAHRSLRPLPPRWAAHEDAMTRSPLAQFIVLSMLLHALAIMLFGAPSGGSREGRAIWGSLDVVIRGPLREEKVEPPRAAPESRPVVPEAAKGAAPAPPILAIPPKAAPEVPAAFEVPPPSEPQPSPAPQPDLPAPPVPAVPIREIPAAELPALPRLEQAAPLPIEPLPVPPPAAPAPAPQRQIAPIELEALPRMQPLPELPVEAAPGAIERVEAPPSAPPVAAPPRVAPPPAPPRAETPRAEPQPVETRRIETPVVSDSPFRTPPMIGPRAGAPPADYDPTAAPSLDAEALRRRAGEIARQGSGQRAVLAFPMPPIPERKTKLEEAIEKARKPDCRTAYQSLGLAAIIPLLANELGEGSCRW